MCVANRKKNTVTSGLYFFLCLSENVLHFLYRKGGFGQCRRIFKIMYNGCTVIIVSDCSVTSFSRSIFAQTHIQKKCWDSIEIEAK